LSEPKFSEFENVQNNSENSVNSENSGQISHSTSQNGDKPMRKSFSKIALAAGFLFALAFTFSCSSGDGDDHPNGGNEPSSSSGGSSSSSGGVIHGTPVTYQGETYETIVIGTQTWLARNLNYNVSGNKCYDDDLANCTKYGRLYNWATAMALPSNCNSNSCASQVSGKHRGICPTDWHIPNKDEFTALLTAAGSTGKLNATNGWNDSGNGTDDYGFSALPGGYGYADGNFYNVGNFAGWWYASGGVAYSAHNPNGDWNNFYDDDLVSVRCLQD
jgi:uncharacterized protein (TIGR02145 family)